MQFCACQLHLSCAGDFIISPDCNHKAYIHQLEFHILHLNIDHNGFKQLFELSPDPAWIIDDNRFVECNEAAARMMGYVSRKELLNVHPSKLSPPMQPDGEDSYVKAERMMAIAKDHGLHRFEWLHAKADGTNFFAEVTLSVIQLRNRKIIYCIWRDITESKRFMQELLSEEEKFRVLVEQSIAGIFIIQDGKLTYVNPRAAEIVGQGSVDELIGTDPLVWVAEADRGKVAESLRQLVDGDVQRVKLEFGVLRQDGVEIKAGVNAARATHKGQLAVIGMVQDISEKTRAEVQIQSYIAQLEAAFMSTVQVAMTMGEMRDPYTAGHERRVAQIAIAIGNNIGFDKHRLEGLRVTGSLHDIGKINIPADILAKPGKLSAIEYQLVKEHAQSGYNVLKDVAFPWPVADIVLQHHERMDGSGYPQGLKGEAILFESRIIAVADVVEAMCSHRPYRPELGVEKALEEIERGRGTAYDANVADACICLFRKSHYQLPA